MRYLTRVRLSQAAGYLSEGQLTIHEIARFAGYQDNASFSKAFKREFGRTPGAYRDGAHQPLAIEIA
jgi:AraC-like DNA-binding protein